VLEKPSLIIRFLNYLRKPNKISGDFSPFIPFIPVSLGFLVWLVDWKRLLEGVSVKRGAEKRKEFRNTPSSTFI
jgi:hypothetical protein